MPSPSAYQVAFGQFLEEISRCFVTGAFDDWRRRTALPFSLVTSRGPVVLVSETQLRRNFDLYLEACATMRLDQIYRKPIALEPCPDGTWLGTYETNLLSHGVRACPPYTSTALLFWGEDGFIASAILNARGHHDWTGRMPDPGAAD